MRKTLLVLAAALLVTMCAPVMAQTFSDVPTDHWAYQAVQELAQRGLIIGYPDGTFGGKRALTRYEFAMAISRMLPLLRQIVAEEVGRRPGGGGVSQEDFNALRRRVEALENRPAGTPEVTRADLDRIRRLVDEFRDELATLGVDVDTLKRDVADLRARMEAVEERLSRLPEVSAAINYIARGENVRSSTTGPVVDLDGRLIDRDTRILEGVRSLFDVDLSIRGKIGSAATATAVFNGGNYLNWLRATGGDSMSIPASANIFFADPLTGTAGAIPSPVDAPQDVEPWLLYADIPASLGFLKGADLTVGKFPFQLTPYTLRMLDVDSYTYNQKTDSGDYPMTGGSLSFKLGPVGLLAYAARHGGSDHNLPRLAGAEGGDFVVFIPGLFVPAIGGLGAVPILNDLNQSAGIRATIGTPFAGTLGVHYLQFAANNAPITFLLGPARGSFFERLAVFGGDFNATIFRGIIFNGSFTRSQWQNGSGDKAPGLGRRDAWDARFTIPIGKISIQAGYRQIDPNFTAPGNWGKIGYEFNPVDIKGPLFSIDWPFARMVTLKLAGEFYKGVGTAPDLYNAADPTAPLQFRTKDDKVHRYLAGVKFGLTSSNSVDLGVEHVFRSFGISNTSSHNTFATIGLGHTFNPNTSMKLMYQFLDERTAGRSDKGGIALTQFMVKF